MFYDKYNKIPKKVRKRKRSVSPLLTLDYNTNSD
jgi:hypothetical protein